MGQLHIFCHPPEIYIPTEAKNAYDVALPKDLHMVMGRQKCIGDILVSLKQTAGGNYDSYLKSGNYLPWQPWSLMHPCVTADHTTNLNTSFTSVSVKGELVISTSVATIRYGGINSVGILTARIHPDSCFPAVGDYIIAVWSVDTGKNINDPITGDQVFYGRITKVTRNAHEIAFVAYDALAPLLDTRPIVVNGVTAPEAIHSIALTAGVYIYMSDGYVMQSIVPIPKQTITRIFSGACLDAIQQLLDLWYIETGFRYYLRASGGMIEICYYDRGENIDVIDATMMRSWEFEQNTDHTYTRVYITYPEKTLVKTSSTNEVIRTETKSYIKAAHGLLFRYPRYHTFNSHMGGRSAAIQQGDFILQNHGQPSFLIRMYGVVGMTHLRPGMNVAVPFILDETKNAYVGICTIREITHTMNPTDYTMDILVECDPYQWGGVAGDQIFNTSFNNRGYTETWWRSGITITTLDTDKIASARKREVKRVAEIEEIQTAITTGVDAISREDLERERKKKEEERKKKEEEERKKKEEEERKKKEEEKKKEKKQTESKPRQPTTLEILKEMKGNFRQRTYMNATANKGMIDARGTNGRVDTYDDGLDMRIPKINEAWSLIELRHQARYYANACLIKHDTYYDCYVVAYRGGMKTPPEMIPCIVDKIEIVKTTKLFDDANKVHVTCLNEDGKTESRSYGMESDVGDFMATKLKKGMRVVYITNCFQFGRLFPYDAKEVGAYV